MRVGILSDSHGRVEATRRAVRLLLDHGADLLLHLGDLCGDAVIDELAGHNARIVFGNCDDDIPLMGRYAESVGVRVDHPAGRIQADGKLIVFTHGHLSGPLDQAVRDQADYILHGHTHELRDERRGHSRIINPGALFRAERYTVALLEPAHDALEILDVPRS